MAKTREIAFMVEFEVHEGKEEELEAFLPTMMEAAAAESGTLAYHCYRSGAPRQWCFYESYADTDATLTHMENFEKEISGTYMPLITPKRIVVFGDLKDELHARMQPLFDGAVSDIEARNYTPISGYPA